MNKVKDQLKERINTMTRLVQDSNTKVYEGIITYLVNLFMKCYSETYYRPSYLTEETNTSENFMLLLNLFSDELCNMLSGIEKDFKLYTKRERSITELHSTKNSLNYNLNNTEGLKKNFAIIEDSFVKHFSEVKQHKFEVGLAKEFNSFINSFLNLILEFVTANYQALIKENQNLLTKNSNRIVKLAHIKLKQEVDSEVELENQGAAKEFICPLTAARIEEGCISIKCGHYFDKNAIESSIKNEAAKKIPCPNSGCDKIISLTDLTKLYAVDLEKEIRKFAYILT